MPARHKLEFDTREFDVFIREVTGIFGFHQTNERLKLALRGTRTAGTMRTRSLRQIAVPLRKSFQRRTPVRTGDTRKSAGYRLEKDEIGRPVLLVGGRRKLGGFVYNFLKGTKPRKTKKGYYRGIMPDFKVIERTWKAQRHIVTQNYFHNLSIVFIEVFTNIQRKIYRARSHAKRNAG